MKKRTEEHGEITKRKGENDKEAETTEGGESEQDGSGGRRETGVVWGYGEVSLVTDPSSFLILIHSRKLWVCFFLNPTSTPPPFLSTVLFGMKVLHQ